jgi:hypothetical protein
MFSYLYLYLPIPRMERGGCIARSLATMGWIWNWSWISDMYFCFSPRDRCVLGLENG